MGWKAMAHKLGFDMTRHYTFTRGEVRVEVWTAADGETFEHAELYKFGRLVDESHWDAEMVRLILDWLELAE
jgi:hypothetical protein